MSFIQVTTVSSCKTKLIGVPYSQREKSQLPSISGSWRRLSLLPHGFTVLSDTTVFTSSSLDWISMFQCYQSNVFIFYIYFLVLVCQLLIILYPSVKTYSEKFFTFDSTVSIAFVLFTVCRRHFPPLFLTAIQGNHNATLPLCPSLTLLRSKWTEVSTSEFDLPPNLILHKVNSAANICSILLCACSLPLYFSSPSGLLKEFQRPKPPKINQKNSGAFKDRVWLIYQKDCAI